QLVIQHQQPPPRQGVTQLRHADQRLQIAPGHRFAQWHLYAEHRAAPRLRPDLDAVDEHLGDALDDGQSKADAASLGGTLEPELIEFEEDRLQLVLGDATAGIPDLDAQRTTAFTRAEQYPATFGVTAGIAEKVAQDAAQQAEIGLDRIARNEVDELQPRRRGDWPGRKSVVYG